MLFLAINIETLTSTCRWKVFRLDCRFLLARSSSSHRASAVVRMAALLVAHARRLEREVMGVEGERERRRRRRKKRSVRVARRYGPTAAHAAQLGHFGEEGIVGVDVRGVVLPPRAKQHRLGGQRLAARYACRRRRRRGLWRRRRLMVVTRRRDAGGRCCRGRDGVEHGSPNPIASLGDVVDDEGRRRDGLRCGRCEIGDLHPSLY